MSDLCIDRLSVFHPQGAEIEPLEAALRLDPWEWQFEGLGPKEGYMVPTIESGSVLAIWVIERTSLSLKAELDSLLQKSPFVEIILITQEDDPSQIHELLRQGAADVIAWEEIGEQLHASVRRAYRRVLGKLRYCQSRMMEAGEKGFQQGAARLLHDLNSPLTAIQNAVDMIEMMREKENLEPDARHRLIRTGVDNASRVSNQWHDFLFAQPDLYSTVNLFQVLGNALLLTRNSLKHIQIQTDPKAIHPDHMGPIPVLHLPGDDISYLTIFHHLIRNAMEAMDQTSKPVLRVHVQQQEREVSIFIDDNGPGVEESIKDRIWKDFVTTKEGRYGLGLGIVRYLLMLHGGGIRYGESTLGGACFRLDIRRKSALSVSF